MILTDTDRHTVVHAIVILYFQIYFAKDTKHYNTYLITTIGRLCLFFKLNVACMIGEKDFRVFA